MNVLQDYLKNKGTNLITQTISSADNRFHSHVFFEIFYITSKSILHEVNGLKKTLYPGDICFLRPGDVHTFHRHQDDDCSHRDILLAVNLVQKTCNFLDPSLYNVLTSSTQPFIFRLSQLEFNNLEEYFTGFSNLQAISMQINISHYENFLATFLFHILLSNLQNHNSVNTPQLLKDIIEELNNNANFVKSLGEILDGFHYNKSYISRIFKKHIGITVSKYFINSRIFYSSKLLRLTQSSIAEIAILSGFDTITYYNRMFKKQFGLTPTEYRRSFTIPIPASEKAPKNLNN